MAIENWGVNMYGLFLNDLELKEGSKIDHIYNKLLTENTVVLSNGKPIVLSGEYFRDSCRHAIGFCAIFPWAFKDCNVSKEDVQEAVYSFVRPYTDMHFNAVCGKMDYISLPNSGDVVELDENGEWEDVNYAKEKQEQGA